MFIMRLFDESFLFASEKLKRRGIVEAYTVTGLANGETYAYHSGLLYDVDRHHWPHEEFHFSVLC